MKCKQFLLSVEKVVVTFVSYVPLRTKSFGNKNVPVFETTFVELQHDFNGTKLILYYNAFI